MEWHNAVNISKDILKANLEEELNIPKEYSVYREKFVKMRIKLESMYHGHLSSIKAVQLRIEVENRDRKMILWVPYRARRKERELNKEEIDGMLYMKVIEPVQTNGSHQLCSSWRKTSFSASAPTMGSLKQWRSGAHIHYGAGTNLSTH